MAGALYERHVDGLVDVAAILRPEYPSAHDGRSIACRHVSDRPAVSIVATARNHCLQVMIKYL
jgi:hypothetical protein